MSAFSVLPSGLIQVMVTFTTAAPTWVTGVVMLRDETSFVVAVQEPSTFFSPLLRVQFDGISVIVSVTSSWVPVGSTSPKLIKSPAMPAGNFPFDATETTSVGDALLWFPAASVMVAMTLYEWLADRAFAPLKVTV